MKYRNCILGFVFSFALLFCGAVVQAQDATGRIIGNVSDPSGSPVPEVKVTITNDKTLISQDTSTDRDGFYQVLSLPIGSYTVTVEKAGFRRQVFDHQTLQINQSLRLDAKLVIGQQSEVVEVTGQAPNVETVSDTIGGSVIGETIQRAPLNGRNVLDLAALQPGVAETNSDSGAAGTYSIAGGRSDSVTYLLDGSVNNNLINNAVVYNPNPDTIAEFRILESNYSAEYGRNGGGVISVVTKSGTNEFHGSGFEFLRNDAFNANTFFNKVDGLPRDVLKRNQYGGTIGGPIKKDKFFFFVGYQGQRLSSQTTTGSNTVYTPAQLNGDFSGGGTPGNCPNADPNVVAFLQTNPYFQEDPASAACGIIDPTKIDPVAQKYIAAGLIPTNPNGQADYQGAHTDNRNELTMKFDLLFSEKNILSITMGGFRNPILDPFNYATVPGFPDLSRTNNYFLSGNYARTITPNLVNELRAFTQRSYHEQDYPGRKLPTYVDLGINISSDLPTGPPNLWTDSGMYVGFSLNGPTKLANNTFGLTDTVSYIHGRHNFKIGGGISAFQNNTVYAYYVNGEFDFYDGGSGSGTPLADILLGAPSQFFQYPNAPSNVRSKATYGFFQDEWRISRRLTLNLGVRYEYNQPKLDTKGRSFSVVPGLQSTVFTGAPVGMVFPGDKGAPVGVNFSDKNDWAPRVGFAWDPRGNGKTSVRGGFGVFYDVLKGEDNLQFNGQPPFFSSTAPLFDTVVGQFPGRIPYLSDPFPNSDPLVPNPFPSKPPQSDLNFADAGFLPINAGYSVYLVDPHLRTPYTYQYNLSVQHELIPGTVIEVGYVGNSAHGLTSLQDINPFVLGTTDRVLNLTPGNSVCQDRDGNSTSGVTDSNQLCSFATMPEFKNISKANYNSLQASLTKQIANSRYLGRTYFTLSYTFSHGIDNASGFRQRSSSVPTYHPNLYRGASDQDVRNRLTFSGGWDLPFDTMWKSGPNRLTHGWSLFPIVTWRSGIPFDVYAHLSGRYDPGSEGPSGAGDPYNVHPNIVGSLSTLDPRQTRTFVGYGTGSYWFDPSSLSRDRCGTVVDSTCLPTSAQVVADPSLATYGTLPRNYLRGPGYINFDLALSKTTTLTERLKLEFRAEFFNVFNHVNFENPGINGDGTNMTDPQLFGQITSTYDPRIIQLAARITF